MVLVSEIPLAVGRFQQETASGRGIHAVLEKKRLSEAASERAAPGSGSAPAGAHLQLPHLPGTHQFEFPMLQHFPCKEQP